MKYKVGDVLVTTKMCRIYSDNNSLPELVIKGQIYVVVEENLEGFLLLGQKSKQHSLWSYKHDHPEDYFINIQLKVPE
jgi:hypothetical protein